MNRRAFTLIEFMIAMFIASIVMAQLFQGMRHSVTFLRQGRELMAVDRSVSLVFNQMERDLSGAFIPTFEQETQGDKKEEEKKGKEKKEEPKKEKQLIEKKQKQYPTFIASIQEGALRRPGEKKRELLDKVNFITVNPLQIYGEAKPRLARVEYALKHNKQQSSQVGKVLYDLVRRETANLSNVKFVEIEGKKKKEVKDIILTTVIARNVKELYLEFVMPREKKDKDKKSEEERPIHSFTWGDSKDKQDRVPKFIKMRFVVWNSTGTREFPFETTVPIFSYPTDKQEKKKEDKKETAGKDEKKQPQQQQK